jgi:hypothetical protein
MEAYYCPIEYSPRRRYSRDEIVELIRPHQGLLCFFAQVSGYRQCILGVDLGEYDPADQTVPVLVMSGEEARPLLQVHGRRFRQAYRVSGPGKPLVVTFSDGRLSGWFKLEWRLDPERVMSQGIQVGPEEPHNPVIGYLLVDETYSVISPTGAMIDPAFYSRQEAREAAEVYGVSERVHEVIELYLEGIMNVVIEDVGDIQVDGRTARRFVCACEQRGLPINREESKEIDESVRDTVYSCRQLLTG